MFSVSLAPLPPLLAAAVRVTVLGRGIVEAEGDGDLEVRYVTARGPWIPGAVLAIWGGDGPAPPPEDIGAAAVASLFDEPAVLRAELERLAPEDWVGEATAGPARLTPRERGILARVSTGATSREIARALGISERTVEVHRRNLLKKLGVPRSAGLVGLVVRGEVAVAR
jgi:DNA-binding CsgD family transcriptional regulator